MYPPLTGCDSELVRRAWLFTLHSLLLVACAATPAVPGPELFDEQSGNTLTVVAKPLIFARDRTDVAAHARDYATLVAIEVDHSGAFKDYLLLYRWSTVDERMSPLPTPEQSDVRLFSEGREMNLKPLESVPIGVDSVRGLHVPTHGKVVVRAFAVDLDLLRFIAASRTLVLEMPHEPLDAPYRIWHDGRGALNDFVHQTSAP